MLELSELPFCNYNLNNVKGQLPAAAQSVFYEQM